MRLLEGLLAFSLGGPFDPALYPALVEGIEVNAETGEMTVHVNEAFLAQLRRGRHVGPANDPSPRPPANSRRNPLTPGGRVPHDAPRSCRRDIASEDNRPR